MIEFIDDSGTVNEEVALSVVDYVSEYNLMYTPNVELSVPGISGMEELIRGYKTGKPNYELSN